MAQWYSPSLGTLNYHKRLWVSNPLVCQLRKLSLPLSLTWGGANSLLLVGSAIVFPKRVENFQNILLICLKVQKKYNISFPNDKKNLKISTLFKYLQI
jgi:hypothetical protein